MYCGKCGNENADDVRFCTRCGADLARQTPPPASDTLDGSRTVLAEELVPGRVLARRYEIRERLGSGGMGEVFKASDRDLDGMAVAIKVLPPVLARNKRSVEGLKREAAISLRLSHQNICRLHTFHSDGELKFLVMEYIEGRTLEDLLDSKPDRRVPFDELLPIAQDVAEALDYAHGLKPAILHRDIKPSNIMVMPEGRGKVLDFGIARELRDSMTRVTGRQETSGTLQYMSPEQFRGEGIDARSDIYSFCAVLYETLAGVPLVNPSGSMAWQIQEKEFEGLKGLPDRLNAALRWGLAKVVSDRASLAAELLAGPAGVSPSRVAPAKARAPGRVELKVPPGFRPQAGTTAELYTGTGLPKEIVHEATGIELVFIPAGEFLMGSPASEAGRGEDETQHEVTLTKPFYIGKCEVTQGEWQKVIGSNPSRFTGNDRLPVEEVSWEDCQAFLRKAGSGLRLPTEAEWEYACRAGSTRAFCFGHEESELGDYAWFDGNSGAKTHPVGGKKPNAWGLHDMHGNVWEWCADWYGAYPNGPVTDPTGPASGEFRVLRGGSWLGTPWLCRAAFRGRLLPDFRFNYDGFRIALALE